jgi:hypothetical protein
VGRRVYCSQFEYAINERPLPLTHSDVLVSYDSIWTWKSFGSILFAIHLTQCYAVCELMAYWIVRLPALPQYDFLYDATSALIPLHIHTAVNCYSMLLRCVPISKLCLTSWTNPPGLSARHRSPLCDRASRLHVTWPIQLSLQLPFYSGILFWTWRSDPSLVPYLHPPFRILPSTQPSRSRRSPCSRHSETQPC